MRKSGENTQDLYGIDGIEALGSYLQIQPYSTDVPDISVFSIQWYRLGYENGKREPISGMYA